jgi:hypothetical protein
MKSKVIYSTYCNIITYAVFIIFAIGLVVSYGITAKFIALCIIFAALIFAGVYYCPISIETGKDAFIIHRPISDKRIPYSQIASAEQFMQSGSSLQLRGSGGFMGYWGYFQDVSIGSYFGYYGKKSQCFLIKLKSGAKYVISCEDRDVMIVAINEHIRHN